MGRGISQIKETTSGLTETYAMRMRLQSYDTKADKWVLFSGFFNLPEGGSQSTKEVGKKVEVCIGTWNVWFDHNNLSEKRWNSLIDILLAKEVDVIALQEVSAPSNKVILSRPDIQRDWVTSDVNDILERSRNWYGTTILVRKSFMIKNGLDKLDCGLVRYESRLARTALVMEFGNVDGVKFRLLTSHFESYPEPPLRPRQFATAARLLALPPNQSIIDSFPTGFSTVDQYTSLLNTPEGKEFIAKSAPGIICGDTNVDNCEELDILLEAPLNYLDTFASRHLVSEGQEKYTTHPTFCTTYPNHKNEWTPKRLDYILARGFGEVKEVELVGNERIGDDERGKDGGLYPSDHLGVVARLVV